MWYVVAEPQHISISRIAHNKHVCVLLEFMFEYNVWDFFFACSANEFINQKKRKHFTFCCDTNI